MSGRSTRAKAATPRTTSISASWPTSDACEERASRSRRRKENHMDLGMIGLGRMGTNMVRRLQRAGHQCVVYDLHPEAKQALVKEGAVGTTSLEDFTHKLKKPRVAWMMVPAAVVDPTLNALVPLLERDDVV